MFSENIFQHMETKGSRVKIFFLEFATDLNKTDSHKSISGSQSRKRYIPHFKANQFTVTTAYNVAEN